MNALDRISNFASFTPRSTGRAFEGDERQCNKARCVEEGRIDVDETTRSLLPFPAEEESDIEQALRQVGDLRI